MIIEPFGRNDIARFLELAATENWLAEQWEFDFLLRHFPQGCFTSRDNSDETTGFITSIKYGNSGWIGNLIVAPRFRGQGFGETLFKASLQALKNAGAETIWLTASTAGKTIYEKKGFSAIDTIIRWSGSGRQRHTGNEAPPFSCIPGSLLNSIDYETWGDRRDELLNVATLRGRLVESAGGCAVVQPCGDDLQLGPFSAHDSGSAEHVLNAVLDSIPFEKKIYLDSPASNRSALLLFNRKRMRISGSNELMYAGKKPDYRPQLLYGLATMGSCG